MATSIIPKTYQKFEFVLVTVNNVNLANGTSSPSQTTVDYSSQIPSGKTFWGTVLAY